jgi:hypothetical protein
VVLGFDSLDPYLVSSWCMRFDLEPLISALPHFSEISALGVWREDILLVSDVWKSTCAFQRCIVFVSLCKCLCICARTPFSFGS